MFGAPTSAQAEIKDEQEREQDQHPVRFIVMMSS